MSRRWARRLLRGAKIGVGLAIAGYFAKKAFKTDPLFVCPGCGKRVERLEDAWAPGRGIPAWYHYDCRPVDPTIE